MVYLLHIGQFQYQLNSTAHDLISNFSYIPAANFLSNHTHDNTVNITH